MASSRRILLAPLACSLVAALLAANSAQAGFHVMQIEQIIGGVNGDTSAQAVQLRLRNPGQNQFQFASGLKVVALDAAGANPVTLALLPTAVTNGNQGDRVLIATANFGNYTSNLVKDFTITNPIPASYLPAGQIQFRDSSTIWYSVSWGGASFTGSTLGATFTNDDNGIFGPAVAGALPSTNLKALFFDGNAGDVGTTNVADYALTTGAATFVNNARTNFILTTPPKPGDFTHDNTVDGNDLLAWQRGESPTPLSPTDLATWKTHFGEVTASAAANSIPEPYSALLLAEAAALYALARKRRRPPTI